MSLPMTGPAWVALLTLVAVIAVLWWALADHLTALSEPDASGPVVIDESGRLLATQELPIFRPGRHRARRWSR